MAVTGNDIVRLSGRLMLDEGHVRWPDSTELFDWIKEGRREMAVRKPAVFGKQTRVAHTLAAGCFQQVQTVGAFSIASVDSNSVSGRAVRLATREQFDAFNPQWRSDTGSEVENWFPDQSNPIGFWVYPACAGQQVYLRVNVVPEINSLNDTVLDFETHASVLVNYVVYRAFSKEDEVGAAQKAAAYLQLFQQALS